MRFQVPQFIEIEDKIFGPLTFKQFVYLAGSVGLAIILYAFLPRFIAIIIDLPIVAFGASLAFYKVNGKPFIFLVEAGVKYFFGSKLYIWKREEKAPQVGRRSETSTPQPEVYVPKLSQSKLKDLAWSLDVSQNTNPVTRDEEK